MKIERIKAYLAEISAQWKTGAATELSYRAALQSFLADVIPGVTVVNEPSHIDCGAPDMLVRTNAATHAPIGYVETKDIDDGDLDGNGKNKEQFDRYKADLDNIIFTDYLDFRFYSHVDAAANISTVRIATLVNGNLVAAPDAELERFAALVDFFGTAKPRPITSPARLATLMAGKARLLSRAIKATLAEDKEGTSTLANQMETFRKILIHDLTPEAFADIYAQTVTYGMFAARLHDTTPEDFSRAEAAALIPKTNPFLRQLFQYIAIDLDDSVEWIIDDLVTLFGAVDVEKVMKGYGAQTFKTDPILHFYEDFLAAYDPKLRKSRGVWYTPDPVVNYIVRAVDWILSNVFKLPGGLADPTKVTVAYKNEFKKNARAAGSDVIHKEIHRVQLLDPAAGTGTFIASAVRCIYEKVVATMGKGAWQGYVAENLLPRLNGFEILMASYAMAHLKLDMLLAETGYVHETNERLRVYLTNSLEPYDKETGTLFAAALAQEANEANFIKRDCPVMVVIGNPPYSVSSSNKGEWIQEKIADYKQGLNEKKLNLDDDYIKFIRLGQHYVEKNGEGVLAYISNNSFLDGITHRQMRKSLCETFDEIYVLNLHGNARKKETAPDGSKDENVFDIMQGVSINIFVKRGRAGAPSPAAITTQRNGSLENDCGGRGATRPTCVVRYADLYGLRKDKYDFLDGHGIDTIDWQTLDLQEPYYFFVPKDFGLQEEYEKGFKIDELMPVNNSGIQTKCDELTLRFSAEEIHSLISDMKGLSFDQLRSKYSYADKEGRDWSLMWAQNDIVESRDGKIIKIQYKPFDYRYTYYTGHAKGFIAYPRASLGELAIKGDLFLATMRQVTGTKETCEVMATETLFADRTFCSTNGTPYLFPLYLYGETMGQEEKTPNFDPAIYAKICAAVNADAAAMTGRDGVPSPSAAGGGTPALPDAPQTEEALAKPVDAMVSIASNRRKPPYSDAIETIASTANGGFASASEEDSTVNLNLQPQSSSPSPEDVFNYIYGVLHTPAYREKYREFLKIDFPRIPYPKDAAEFQRIAEIGAKLVQVHLLKDPNVTNPFVNPYARFEGTGSAIVDKVEAREANTTAQPSTLNSQPSTLNSQPALRVYINADKYFDNVPQAAWDAYIGGYQPAQKWLKDRKGRVLTNDELAHYKSIIKALEETAKLTAQLSAFEP